jgi:hypothetical protein
MTIEETLRDALEARADSVHSDPVSAWETFEEAQGVATRWRRPTGRVIALAAAAAIAAAIAIPLFLIGGQDRGQTGKGGTPSGSTRPDVPRGWKKITDPERDLAVWAPAGWRRLGPGTSAGGIERLTVGTEPRPGAQIVACGDPTTTVPSSYVSIWEFPDGTSLMLPQGGENELAPTAFQPRRVQLPRLSGATCPSDGVYGDPNRPQNDFRMIAFSDRGRRFYARVVTFGDTTGNRIAEAIRVLKTLRVEPLTTPTTTPPPPPPTVQPLTRQEVRARLLDVDVFAAGQCRDAADQMLPCDAPHVSEVYASYRFYPGTLDPPLVGPEADPCGMFFEDFTGSTQAERTDVNVNTHFDPDAPIADTQEARCVVYGSNTAGPLVGSIRDSNA